MPEATPCAHPKFKQAGPGVTAWQATILRRDKLVQYLASGMFA